MAQKLSVVSGRIDKDLTNPIFQFRIRCTKHLVYLHGVFFLMIFFLMILRESFRIWKNCHWPLFKLHLFCSLLISLIRFIGYSLWNWLCDFVSVDYRSTADSCVIDWKFKYWQYWSKSSLDWTFKSPGFIKGRFTMPKFFLKRFALKRKTVFLWENTQIIHWCKI